MRCGLRAPTSERTPSVVRRQRVRAGPARVCSAAAPTFPGVDSRSLGPLLDPHSVRVPDEERGDGSARLAVGSDCADPFVVGRKHHAHCPEPVGGSDDLMPGPDTANLFNEDERNLAIDIAHVVHRLVRCVRARMTCVFLAAESDVEGALRGPCRESDRSVEGEIALARRLRCGLERVKAGLAGLTQAALGLVGAGVVHEKEGGAAERRRVLDLEVGSRGHAHVAIDVAAVGKVLQRRHAHGHVLPELEPVVQRDPVRAHDVEHRDLERVRHQPRDVGPELLVHVDKDQAGPAGSLDQDGELVEPREAVMDPRVQIHDADVSVQLCVVRNLVVKHPACVAVDLLVCSVRASVCELDKNRSPFHRC
mmetsp:Transcript_10682/g.25456  ORF Transcript_10682/g.25456 Transcript_10682/m.25456 type:complete len:365 (+) Transcript_10682:212-1306(+)